VRILVESGAKKDAKDDVRFVILLFGCHQRARLLMLTVVLLQVMFVS
jgi:hypothetical protein